MIALGQFRDTFIIAMDDEGLCIIDQHVAHERVLFERIMEKLTNESLESQRLLIPAVLELPPAERAALVVEGGSARAIWLRGRGVRRRQHQGHRRCRRCCRRTNAMRRCARSPTISKASIAGCGIEDALKQIAATTACHAAVKAHYPLTLEKMHHILEELRATAYSTVCPHGRPVMLRITRREIEKNFDRICSRAYCREKLRTASASSSKFSNTDISFIIASRRWLCPTRWSSFSAPPFARTILSSAAIMPTPALSM